MNPSPLGEGQGEGCLEVAIMRKNPAPLRLSGKPLSLAAPPLKERGLMATSIQVERL